MDMKELISQFKETAEALKGLIKQQEQEIKAYGETTTETAKKISELEKRLESIGQDLKAAQDRLVALEAQKGRPGYITGGERKSIGQMFVESEQYKSMLARGAKQSDPFMVKALSSDAASAGALVETYRYPQIIAPMERPLRIRDLLSVATTTSNAIEYVEETGFVNAADVVAEGSAKPESSLAFTLKTESVKTIAHWIPATNQIIADAAQLRSYIDNRLIYGLKLVEENKLLYGTGVSGDLQGIMTHPNVQQYAWSEGSPGDTKLDAIRRAITKARVAEYPVTGIVLNPQDWEDIELAKGSDGHYIWATVTDGGQQRLWRVPVVETTAIQPGECLLGAFQLGAMIWDREQSSIRIAEQHADFFIKNMVAILCEERLAFTIFRPEAFVVVVFDDAPTQE